MKTTDAEGRIWVNPESNREPNYWRKHIKVGDKVIIVDGSYMVRSGSMQDDRMYAAMDTRKDGLYELFTVTTVNRPMKTNYGQYEWLAHHNNCVIKSNTGVKYYCSKINIIKFT